MGNTTRGGDKVKQQRGTRRGDRDQLSPEDFDPGPARRFTGNGEKCGQCHINPVLSWMINFERSGRLNTETKFFFKGNPADNVKLCTTCAAAVADDIVVKEMANISRNFASAVTTLTGNETAGHAYHAFGVNAAEIMQEVQAGADIVDALTQHLHAQVEANNAWADENKRADRRISVPQDEAAVRSAVELALVVKDGRLGRVTNLIADHLVKIESKYPDERYDIVITEARRMKSDVTLELLGVLITDAKRAVVLYLNSPDGASLAERLNALEEEREAMLSSGPRRDKSERSDFDLFVEGRKLYQQAMQLAGAQERRDELKRSYTGRFSAAFRTGSSTPAAPEEPSGTLGPTVGDNIDPDTRAKLGNIGDGIQNDDQDKVPAVLSNADTTDDEQPVPVTDETPAPVDSA